MACFAVFLLSIVILVVSSEENALLVFKWDICPTITANNLPSSCSSFLKTSNTSSELVDQFSDTFIAAIDDHGSLEEAFDTSVAAPIVSKIGYSAIKDSGLRAGVVNPGDGAKLIAETVLDTFNKLTNRQFKEFFGRSIGEYLMAEGILTQDNVSFFAKSFANSMINALSDSPLTVYHGQTRGMKEFLIPLGLYNPDKWDTWHSHAIYTLYKLSGTKQ